MIVTTATHIGRRTSQQDSFIAESPFFAVADGMGGYESGDVASRELLAGMAEALKIPGTHFLAAFRYGHARMRATQEALADPSMGTTLTAIWLKNGRCSWLQAGDSRLYHRRDGQLRQVTTDQNLPPPSDNVLTRCVQARGGELEWEPEHMGRFDVEEGDDLILCTDGVSKVLTDWSGATSPAQPHFWPLPRRAPVPARRSPAIWRQRRRLGCGRGRPTNPSRSWLRPVRLARHPRRRELAGTRTQLVEQVDRGHACELGRALPGRFAAGHRSIAPETRLAELRGRCGTTR